MPKPPFALPLAIFLLISAVPRASPADQLQCVSAADAERAVGLLQPDTVIIAFCSLCDDFATVVRVRGAKPVTGCDTEVQVSGTVIARSSTQLHETYPKNVRYQPAQDAFAKNVDLAYVYVQTKRNRFDWLGGVLGLQASVNVATIVLPEPTYAAIGQHLVPQTPSRPLAEAPAVKAAAVKFSWFATPGLREVIAAFDGGNLENAQQAADKMLAGMLARVLAKSGSKGLPPPAALRQLIELALRERLSMPPHLPLRNLHAGRELAVLDTLPTAKLEEALAVLAVWAAITTQSQNQAPTLELICRALVVDPTTLADLQRRAPRAAALARFYGTLYRAHFAPHPGLDPDERLLVERLRQYFVDEKGAFKGNYAEVLGGLLQRRQ